jgi:hypothetical protein
VADGILLERAGVPAVVLCTDAFRGSGDAMAQAQGFALYRYVTVEHPLASLTPAEIRERAEGALPAIVQILGLEP